MSSEGQLKAFSHQISSYLRKNLKTNPNKYLGVETASACFNCKSIKELLQCELCGEVVCCLCSMKIKTIQRGLLSTKAEETCICFSCRTIILNSLDLLDQDVKSKRNYNFNADTNIIHEPNWVCPTIESKCFWCAYGNADNELVLCSLCGDCFCVKCCVINDISRPIFPCPFNKSFF